MTLTWFVDKQQHNQPNTQPCEAWWYKNEWLPACKVHSPFQLVCLSACLYVYRYVRLSVCMYVFCLSRVCQETQDSYTVEWIVSKLICKFAIFIPVLPKIVYRLIAALFFTPIKRFPFLELTLILIKLLYDYDGRKGVEYVNWPRMSQNIEKVWEEAINEWWRSRCMCVVQTEVNWVSQSQKKKKNLANHTRWPGKCFILL